MSPTLAIIPISSADAVFESIRLEVGKYGKLIGIMQIDLELIISIVKEPKFIARPFC